MFIYWRILRMKSILLAMLLVTSVVEAKTYTGMDVKNGKGIPGSSLRTENFVGTLDIDNLDVSEVIVRAEGSDAYLNNLIFEQDGDVLVVKHKDLKSPTLQNIQGCSLKIQLPRQSPLNIGITNAEAKIADRGGETKIIVNGTGSAIIEGVEGLFVTVINGSGDVHVKNLKGDMESTIQGAGKLVIDAGNSDRFKADIAGAGEINYGGEVKDADLSIAGTGNITINRATGSVSKNVAGLGQINIKSQA